MFTPSTNNPFGGKNSLAKVLGKQQIPNNQAPKKQQQNLFAPNNKNQAVNIFTADSPKQNTGIFGSNSGFLVQGGFSSKQKQKAGKSSNQQTNNQTNINFGFTKTLNIPKPSDNVGRPKNLFQTQNEQKNKIQKVTPKNNFEFLSKKQKIDGIPEQQTKKSIFNFVGFGIGTQNNSNNIFGIPKQPNMKSQKNQKSAQKNVPKEFNKLIKTKEDNQQKQKSSLFGAKLVPNQPGGLFGSSVSSVFNFDTTNKQKKTDNIFESKEEKLPNKNFGSNQWKPQIQKKEDSVSKQAFNQFQTIKNTNTKNTNFPDQLGKQTLKINYILQNQKLSSNTVQKKIHKDEKDNKKNNKNDKDDKILQQIKKDLQKARQFSSSASKQKKKIYKRKKIKQQLIDLLQSQKKTVILQNQTKNVQKVVNHKIQYQNKLNHQLKDKKNQLKKQIQLLLNQIQQYSDLQVNLVIPQIQFEQTTPSFTLCQYWEIFKDQLPPQKFLQKQRQIEQLQKIQQILKYEVKYLQKQYKKSEQNVKFATKQLQNIDFQLIDIFKEQQQFKKYCQQYLGKQRIKLQQQYKRLSKKVKQIKNSISKPIRTSLSLIN